MNLSTLEIEVGVLAAVMYLLCLMQSLFECYSDVLCSKFSFCKGDVFVVENVIDNDWLWVTSQKNKDKGLVPGSLVEDAVSI